MTFPRSTAALRLIGLALGLTAAARAGEWQSLLGDSPFGGAATTTTAAVAGELEFRGVVQEEGLYLVNLYNPATKTSQWVPVKGSAPGLEVQSYDPRVDKVQVNQGGRSLTLSLKQAHVTLVTPAPAPNPAGAPGAPGENAENPDQNNKSREERRAEFRARMENGGAGAEAAAGFRNLPPEAQQMIQEFRRRRAEAAQAQGGQPAQTTRRARPQQ